MVLCMRTVMSTPWAAVSVFTLDQANIFTLRLLIPFTGIKSPGCYRFAVSHTGRILLVSSCLFLEVFCNICAVIVIFSSKRLFYGIDLLQS